MNFDHYQRNLTTRVRALSRHTDADVRMLTTLDCIAYQEDQLLFSQQIADLRNKNGRDRLIIICSNEFLDNLFVSLLRLYSDHYKEIIFMADHVTFDGFKVETIEDGIKEMTDKLPFGSYIVSLFEPEGSDIRLKFIEDTEFFEMISTFSNNMRRDWCQAFNDWVDDHVTA